MTEPGPVAATPAAIEARVESRLVDDSYRISFRSHFIEYPAVGVMAALFWSHAPAVRVISWAAGAFVFIGLRMVLEWYYLRRILPGDKDARQWGNVFTIVSLLHGLLYGSLGIVFFSPGNTLATAFLSIVLCGAAATTLSVLTALPLAYYLSTGAAILPFALRSLMYGGELFTALGMLAVGCFALGAMACHNAHRTLRESVRLRFENLDLVERLRVQTETAEAARREAVQANTAKSKFLAAASHDLRQPIHAQGLFLEVLARTELGEHQRELLASARTASDASADMLNVLLDFSRIEAGVIVPQVRPFPLQPLLNKLESELAPQADAKDIVYRTRETRAAVRSDPVLVELILRNLVSNAIRYTGRGGLLVGCRNRGDRAVVEVWDTGIGIAPADRDEIFREFHQLGNPERDRRKGFGLGLAIARGLARALEHDLALASRPGRGSVFRLALPVAAAAALPERRGSVPVRARPLGMRVLVIDDDEAVREGMLKLLRDWGSDCRAAESIEEALVLAQRQRPELVICDYRLRDRRTGAEAIAALRAAHGERLPALLITGDTAPERLAEASACGVPLLHKPVSPSRLYREIVQALEESAAV